MIILGCDIESTGLDPNVDEIVEIGMVIYDTHNKRHLALHSDMLQTTVSLKDTMSIHGINDEMAKSGYDVLYNPWKIIEHYKPVLIVAHNAEFDKSFMVKRWSEFKSLQWVCTKKDLQHDQMIGYTSSSRLQHLAVDYGLYQGNAHKALWDALTCCEIAAQHDLNLVLAHLNEPRYIIEAWYNGKDFDSHDFLIQKQYLKKAGFKWDSAHKIWVKNGVPESLRDKYVALATNKPDWQSSVILYVEDANEK